MSRLTTFVSNLLAFRKANAPVLAANAPVDLRVVSYERSSFGTSGSIVRWNPDSLVGKQGLNVYAKMRIDEQVKSVVVFVRDAILSRGWVFEFDKQSPLSETERAARIRIIDQIIKRMPGAFVDSLNVISTGREFGFSLVEKVYDTVTIDKKTWKGLAALLGRDPETFNFYTDSKGMLERCEQIAGGTRVDIDLSKFIHYVHNPEFDPYFGRSDLREAYRSWYSKNELIKMQLSGLEKLGGGMLVAQVGADANIPHNSPGYTALQTALSNAKSASSMLLPAGVTAQVFYPANMDAFDKALQWHDMAIAKALLVPQLVSGGTQVQTGSYGQSQTQLESFAWRLKADADRLAACLNDQLFKDLGDLNWGDGEYPQFCFKPLSTEGLRWLIETWSKLIGAEAVIPTEEDEARLREILEMPPRDEGSKTLAEVRQELAPEPVPMPGGGFPGAQPDEPATVGAVKKEIEKNGEKVKEEMARLLARFGFNPDQNRAPDGKWSTMSGYETAALDHYKSTGFYNINESLRKGDTSNSNTQKTIKHLDDAISRSTLEEDTTLYRVIDGKRAGDKYLKVGAIVEDKGFMSTSRSEGAAQRAVKDAGGGRNEATVLEIRAPRGSHALDMESRGAIKSLIKPLGNEGEYLLPRGTSLRIVSVDGRRAVAEIVGTKMSRSLFHTPGGHEHDQSTHGGGGKDFKPVAGKRGQMLRDANTGMEIEAWHDTQSNNWIVVTKDAEGNELGDSTYVYRREEALRELQSRAQSGGQGTSTQDYKWKEALESAKLKKFFTSARDARLTIASARERVDFAVIDRKQHLLASNLSAALSPAVAKAVQKLLGDNDALALLTDNDPSDIANVEFSGIDKGRLRTTFQKALADAWALGREQAQLEVRRLGKKVMHLRDAATFADLRNKAAQFFETNSFRMAGNVADGVRALIQQELQNSVKFGRSPGQTREAIWSRLVSKGFSSREAVRTIVEGGPDDAGILQALDALELDTEEQAAHYLDTLSRTNLFEAMNESRYAEFTDPELDGFVVAFRYSAIMDDRTTQVCEHLHDRVFKADSEVWDTYRPPNHYNCRSILIPITKLDVQDGLWGEEESDEPSIEPQEGFK